MRASRLNVRGNWVLALILALSSGCSLMRAPQNMVNAVVPIGRTHPDPVGLQTQIERFVDGFSTRTSQSLDEYAERAGTAAARVQALQLKLMCVSEVTSIASGPNPNVNLLDLVSIVTLRRMVIQDYWMTTTNGQAFEPWLRVSREQETNVWQLAAGFLQPPQLEELRGAIDQWYAQNPGMISGSFARPQEFLSMAQSAQGKGADRNSVFSLVGLDPTAGLDPAVREVTQTRLFAERAMFTMQRMPFLIRWQTELLTYQVAGQPDVQLVLTNATQVSEGVARISRATESFSQTAAQLPDRISTERKAILEALDQQEGKLRDLAAEVDRSLVAGNKMSTSLNTTIITFDALMKRFGVGEPTTNTVPDTNSPPFNILDYGKVAGQVGTMAKDINTLVGSVTSSVPQLKHLSQQAAGEVQRVVNRAFRLGLVLIGVLLAGSVAAGLIYRASVQKLGRKSRDPDARG